MYVVNLSRKKIYNVPGKRGLFQKVTMLFRMQSMRLLLGNSNSSTPVVGYRKNDKEFSQEIISD